MTARATLPCERVLVMDDNEDMLTSMKDILELGGSTVRTATSGERALQILREGFEPSVFLVDVRLGSGERGDDFARRLRSDPKYARTPFVLVSGDIHELRRLELEDGVATLGKPFDVQRLFEILADICAERG